MRKIANAKTLLRGTLALLILHIFIPHKVHISALLCTFASALPTSSNRPTPCVVAVAHKQVVQQHCTEVCKYLQA